MEILEKVSRLLDTAISHFNTTAILDDQVVNVKILSMIARLRVCFEYVTELLNKRFLRRVSYSFDVTTRQDNLFAELVGFLKTNIGQMSEAHLFILRNIIFKHGFEELKAIVETSGLDLALNFNEIEEVKVIKLKLIECVCFTVLFLNTPFTFSF